MIKNKLLLVPNEPGCYLMKNADGYIIYVGKAKDLKKRLSSYFRGNHFGKTLKLVNEIMDFEYVVVNTENEAFILEQNLIKEHTPKYNILLRDDKSYPYIELTIDDSPRLFIIRNLKKKKNKNSLLFGPYSNVTAARTTVNLLNRMYPLRKCKTYPKRPCLYYHIGQCYGYCFLKVEQSLIDQMIIDVTKFLKGDSSLIVKKIKEEMLIESEKMNYENALELKDLLEYVNITLSKQNVEINDLNDIDLYGYYSDDQYLSIQIFFIRNGKVIQRHFKTLPLLDEINTILSRYIVDFYKDDTLLPKEILVPDIVDNEILSNYLNISVKTPIKGEKKKVLEMANENAKISLLKEIELIKKDEIKTNDSNEELRQLINLNKLERIEIFDNSNLFGNYNVSGMVVFENGKPLKNEYRKYKISIDKNDDYGTLKEVIYRRYFRVIKDNLIKPDLIIVDGGVGQVNIALSVIKSLNLNIKVIGLKKDDKHLTESLIEEGNEIQIEKRSNLFHYLERIQEEVHRYTINYHRQLRSKGSIESVLDNIEGLGPKRKQLILKKYKNIINIKNASNEELEEIIPKKVVEQLKSFLERYE
jgi:excinuclease ABC subunit C